ncbi:esterase [Halalkalibacter akibai]|uniref:Putative hydrolase of the alpha/beta superfamily n=1 Tax=Halalkalibacter akibai (strain ATCC 43226 / DSM 21942 / CIP 109018 / JCM 9157 / 1139) TaxID=1236973 RepID=W4QTG5_HALA3|nr:esterase [Halalkalibacter akibai]GAE35396.1 putative hydrolase of the alpha/beta superfamily [Halalkalibacter akibai JCM 9157]
MITITNETFGNIPTLHVVKEEARKEKNLPTIFFLHGFTSAKEHNLHVAYLLAEKGFRVLLPDALHHGERENQLDKQERDLAFWEIVLTSIRELEVLKITLEEKGLVTKENIGVMGTSMGAITLYGALTQYNWIQSAVSFMGTAYYEIFASGLLSNVEQQGLTIEQQVKEKMFEQIKPFDLSGQLNKLEGRPLFIWHGTEDKVVPYSLSQKLYSELAAEYDETPWKLHFMTEETGHKVSRRAVLKSIEWLNQHLCKVSS